MKKALCGLILFCWIMGSTVNMMGADTVDTRSLMRRSPKSVVFDESVDFGRKSGQSRTGGGVRVGKGFSKDVLSQNGVSASTGSGRKNWRNFLPRYGVDVRLNVLNGWWKDAVRAHQLTQKLVIRPEDPRVYDEISQNAYDLLGLDKNRLFGQSYDEAQRGLAKKHRQEILKWHVDKWALASQQDRDYAANMSKSLNAANDLIKRELESSHPGSPYVLQGRTVEQEEAQRAWAQEEEYLQAEHQRAQEEQRERARADQQKFDDLFAHFYNNVRE